MAKRRYFITCVILAVVCNHATAQYKAIATNLNNKKSFELKPNEEFYFGLNNQNEKLKGKLEAVSENQLVIGGKTYRVNEIAWMDKKDRKPKKNSGQVSRILLYFGGSLFGFSVYEHFEANDTKTAKVSSIIGAGMLVGALGFWAIPRQPEFDFTSKYLLEIIPLTQETK